MEEEEEWYFSVKDVVTILTETTNAKDYISKMRRRDEELSKGWGQIVHPLTVQTAGGPHKENCATLEGIFRIIQSIPSKKRSHSNSGWLQWLITDASVLPRGIFSRRRCFRSSGEEGRRGCGLRRFRQPYLPSGRRLSGI